MAVAPNSTILPADMAALAALANSRTNSGLVNYLAPYTGGFPGAISNAYFGKSGPIIFPDNPLTPASGTPKWLLEMNRLEFGRQAIHSSPITVDQYLNLAAAWPINAVATSKIFQLGTWYSDTDFYYLDNGSPQTLAITTSNLAATNVYNSPTNEVAFPNFQFTITIGGDTNFNFQGGFSFQINFGLRPPGTTAITLASPPFAIYIADGTPGTSVTSSIGFNVASLAPGTYVIAGSLNPTEAYDVVAITSGPLTAIITPTASACPGISGTAQTMMFRGSHQPSGGIKFCIYQNGVSLCDAYGITMISTIAGYFVAKVPGIRWSVGNTVRANYLSNWQFGGVSPCWNWEPLYNAQLGDTIVDVHGIEQTCTTAGWTGSRQPNWFESTGGGTATTPETPAVIGDGITAAIWTNNGSIPGLLSRMVSVPRWNYCNFNSQSTIIGPKPLHPAGWFIYQIFLHRILYPDTPSISVELGVMSSGSWVSFGFFNTGNAPINVMWPVFDTTPLCYKSSEEIDVQAAICNMEPNGSNVGGTWTPYDRHQGVLSSGGTFIANMPGGFSYPMRADVYNWVSGWLSLIS